MRGLDARKIELGRRLFSEKKLSHNDQVSCASCHSLKAGGADGRAKSLGINGAMGTINAPTVFNAGFNLSQFWDGRAATLEKQIDGPLQSPAEMGSSWPEVIGKLKNLPEYVRMFQTIYRADISSDTIRDAIAMYERSLSTPNSLFDRYLRGKSDALTPRAQQGYAAFKSYGCSSCHQGMNAGGNMYQKLGVMAPYFRDRGHVTDADRGRFNVTGNPQDMYMFKVPSLRNVTLTAPYFHDASAATLTDAVRMMAKYQLGRPIPADEVASIVEFLGSLTGELDGHPL